jgi:hypothetical protein
MPDEGFLRRWARLKANGPAAAQPAAAPAAAEARTRVAAVPPSDPRVPHLADAAPAPAPALPTLDDVARLERDSDFSAFVSKGVDKDVQRLAMKKLFADPHFNLIDRLDVYMDDYNTPSPVSEAMLAALHHTKNLFAPLAGAAREAEADTSADPGATAAGGEGALAASGEAGTGGDPNGAAIADDGGALTAPVAAAAPAQLEPMQFHGAAAGGVLQQTQQGKA